LQPPFACTSIPSPAKQKQPAHTSVLGNRWGGLHCCPSYHSTSYVLALMFDIARNLSAAGSAAEASDSKVDLIIRYIQEHYSSPITNLDIGQHFNFHPIYINRLMVKHTGTALHQYLINYRISVALNLLQTTSKSVAEIAYSVGFRDTNYFSKCFKKLVGLSPKKYINASKKASLG
jgi:AraC-like DNA-binding protein